MMSRSNYTIGLLFIACGLSGQVAGDSSLVKALLLSDHTEETSVAFHPDGESLYFSRKGAIFNFGKNNQPDIWEVRSDSTGWSAPVNAGPRLNTEASEQMVSINASADRLYFSRPLTDRVALFVANKEGRRWGAGALVPLPGLDSFPVLKSYFVSADEQILLCCASADPQQPADIYYFLKQADGAWAAPIRIPLSLDSRGDEITAFLTADKRNLIFASNAPSNGQHYDLLLCKRLDDSWQKWSMVQALNSTINTSANEYGLALSPSGEQLAYISDVRAGQAKIIYARTPASITDQLQHNQ